ncbi:MAG: DNA translocase FtsK 4TM domain-containing protein [Holosporales bacterium]|nr:DNA translocase FtsK 4TM domain-containing protein [Holosporales bacterium]
MISTKIQDFFRSLMGFFLLGAAFTLGTALFFYNAEEPSWNTSVETMQNSWFILGNALADVLIQFFGLASGLLPVALCVIGIRKIQKRYPIKGAIFGILGAVFLLSFALGGVPLRLSSWPATLTLGGALGQLVFHASVHCLQPFLAEGVCFIAPIAGCLGGLLFVIALRLSVSPLFSFCKNYWHGISPPKEFSFFGNLKHYMPRFFSSPPLIAKKKGIAEVTLESIPGRSDPFESSESAQKSDSEKKHSAQADLDLAFLGEYTLPSLELLSLPHGKEEPVSTAALAANADQLLRVLNDFGVKGEIVDTKPGPVVTLYELRPAAGIKSSRVIGLAHDIARSMSAISARVAVVPGKNVIGIELPNAKRQTVYLRELLSASTYEKFPGSLVLALGKSIGGVPIVVDLARMPHLLVAGTTGSGKSVSVNTMILSLVYRLSPAQCRFIMIDPKMLELSVYDGIPHLLTPVVTDPKKAVVALKWTVREMENRYKAMARLGVRNIEGYNTRLAESLKNKEPLLRRVQTGFDPESGLPIYEDQPLELTPLPYIVVIVDEMADLMLVAGKDIENAVQRLAQMARAAGIHLIMATQRPSVDVITGTIKANFPTRISFHVTSKIDSRTILGEQGAEQLLGQGDMLYMATGGQIVRIHGPFVSDREVELVVQELKEQGDPQYTEEIVQDEEDTFSDGNVENGGADPIFEEALALVRREGKVSTSFIQRHLQIGYNRAARIVDQMEARGFVSSANHTGKREILG